MTVSPQDFPPLVHAMQASINSGNPQEALDIWQAEGSPSSREFFLLAGIAQQQLDAIADAHASLLSSLQCDSEYPAALRQLAYLSFHTSDYASTITWAERYQQHRPFSHDAFNWKMFALKECGRLNDAEKELAAFAKVFPHVQATLQGALLIGEAKNHAVHNLLMAGRMPAALWQHSLFGQSVFGSWYSLGSETLCRKTLDLVYAGLAPEEDIDYLQALGDLAQMAHKQAEAVEWYERMHEVHAGPINNGLNEALARWAIGDFAAGALAYRRRRKSLKPFYMEGVPEWQGENLGGKTILVHSEQGSGDVMQFIRYMPYLQQQAGTVLFNTFPDILSLLRADTANQQVNLDESVFDHIDYQTWMMDVPAFLRPNGIADFPAETPYLYANADKVTFWKQALDNTPGLKIGLVWSGNPIHINDANRSASLEEWKALAELDGISWFSLQKGTGAAEALHPPAGLAITNLADKINDFADTAAILSNLDLLISVDTSVAHLAGACNIPCWTLLPRKGRDWRWCSQAETPHWYPSMRTFTLEEHENWDGLLRRSILPQLMSMGARQRSTPPQEPLTNVLDSVRQAFTALSHTKALTLAEQALESFPNEPRLNLLAGQAALHLGDTRQARQKLEAVLKVQPRNVLANRMLSGLIGHSDLYQSAAHLQAALRLAPEDNGLWREAAGFFLAQHAPMIAYQIMDHLYANEPNEINATLFAETLMRIGNTEIAAKLVEHINPGTLTDHDQLRWLLYIHAWQGWRDQAFRTLERLSSLFPGDKDDALLIGTVLIRWGDYITGWRYYNQAKWPDPAELPPGIPLWKGESLTHKHLLIYQDQGYGDLIQFFNLLEADAQRHGKITLSVFGEAYELISAQPLPDNVRIISHEMLRREAPEQYACRIGFMHWVAELAPDLSYPPRTLPYLAAQPDLLPQWAASTRADQGFKVGMVWAGNPNHFNDFNRSTQLGDWLPLTQVPGISWYNLQRDIASNQLFEYPQFNPSNIVADCGRLNDTACAITMLDLVITIDSGLAHLSAALGKETWVVLPPRGDFRWQIENDDCPWYPGMRLFRRAINEPWAMVFARVAEALAERAARAKP